MRGNNLITSAMCRGKYLKIRWLLPLLIMPFLASSCSEDSETVSTTGDYCYIKSVTLGTVKRQLDIRDRQGNLIRTTNSTFTGTGYLMTIDQRTCVIENRDSLPYGSQLSAVLCTITFDGSVLTYREKGAEGWLAYNATDSLDLTKTLELRLTSNDNESSRTYTFKVNVHQQEGDSLYWNKCEGEVEQLVGMTDIKAFVLHDKLMALGKKASGIVLAERSGIEAQGTWEELATDLPSEADVQTLRQQESMLCLSTSDGRIFSSVNAREWMQEGIALSGPLTLVEKTGKYFYAVSEGKLLRSADAQTWEEDKLDAEATCLPSSGIRTLSVLQANGNRRIIMVGKNESSTSAVVWNKMWNESEGEENTGWTYFPLTHDNPVPCPRLKHLNLLPYDGKCIAFGGASDDGRHKALDAMFISQDYGITWRPSTELHLPFELEGIDGCIATATDRNNFIWIITNAQVWRGRLNRLGFAQH